MVVQLSAAAGSVVGGMPREKLMCGAERVNSCINYVVLNKQLPAAGRRGAGQAHGQQTSAPTVSGVLQSDKRSLYSPCKGCWIQCDLAYVRDRIDTGSRESGSAVDTPRSTKEGWSTVVAVSTTT